MSAGSTWLAYDVTAEEPALTAMGVWPAPVSAVAQLPLRDGLILVQGSDSVGLIAAQNGRRGSSVAGYARKGAAAHWRAGFGLGSIAWSGVRHDRERR